MEQVSAKCFEGREGETWPLFLFVSEFFAVFPEIFSNYSFFAKNGFLIPSKFASNEEEVCL